MSSSRVEGLSTGPTGNRILYWRLFPQEFSMRLGWTVGEGWDTRKAEGIGAAIRFPEFTFLFLTEGTIRGSEFGFKF